MPTYEYLCEHCKTTFKIFHSIDEKRIKCENCNWDSLKKSVSGKINFNKKIPLDYDIKDETELAKHNLEEEKNRLNKRTLKDIKK